MKSKHNGNGLNKYLIQHKDIRNNIFSIFNMHLEDNELDVTTKVNFINSYLNIIFYTMLEISDDEKINSIKKILCYLNDSISKLNIKTLSLILITITKNLDEVFIEELKKDETYGYFEKLIFFYFENIDLAELYDCDLLNSIIEIYDKADLSNLYELLSEKLFSKEEAIYAKQENVFFNQIIMERLKNKILSFDRCNELLKMKLPSKIKRMVNVDWFKNYLLMQELEKPVVIFDDQLYIGGRASSRINQFSINCNAIDVTFFHEGMHLLQNSDIRNNRFRGNRYYMLKDLILATMISYDDYRKNYASLLFLEEAETLGTVEYLKYKKIQIGLEDEYFTLISNKEIKVLGTIDINGEILKKDELFDILIKENQRFLKRFPILTIEYNLDGTKKSNEEILAAIEKR